MSAVPVRVAGALTSLAKAPVVVAACRRRGAYGPPAGAPALRGRAVLGYNS